MSTATLTRNRYTTQEYLERERVAGFKSEYEDGEIFAMSGATRRHNLITHNIAARLNTCLEETDCEIYSSDMRISIPNTNGYYYPDVVVVCLEPEFEDEREDNLLNPMLIVEVLSNSTERLDRGRKFENYTTITTLQEYVLVSQNEPQITVYRRQADDSWVTEEAHGDEGSITLQAVGCTLPLSRTYHKVSFPAVVLGEG